MYRVTLNNTVHNHKDGITFHEKLSEDLNIGTIFLPQTENINVEPLDEVEVENLDTNEITYVYVSTIKRDTVKFETPKEYNYTLGLTSPTIKLQGIVLPNRKITQPLTGTRKTILTMMQRYLKVYAPELTLSQALQDLVDDVECPEFQWNRPTLFEVFNDLLSEVDSIVTMTDFTTISYLDLNADGDPILDDNLSDVTLEQDIQNYGDTVEVELENAVYKKQNATVVEWQAIKTDEGSILTTENGKVFVEKPIGKIYKVIVKGFISDIYGTEELDITDYVLEKRKYDLASPNDSPSFLKGDFKRNRLYFEEGKNVIDGLCYHESTWIPSLNGPKALINIVKNAYEDKTGINIADQLDNPNVINFVFRIDYEALESVKLRTHKEVAPKHKRTLVNNQDTSYVDYLAFSRKQQSLTNRLAEPKLKITGRYDSLDDVPKLRDIYEGNFKLSEREYSLYDDYVSFKGWLSKNYVLKNLRTSLKRQRRYTQIATDSEALESNHIKEYNLVFSKNNQNLNHKLENYFLQFGKDGYGIKLVYLRFHFDNEHSETYGVSPSIYRNDKSISLTYKMHDNFSVGYQIEEDYGGSRLGVKHTPYVDDNGEFEFFEFRLYKKYNIAELFGSTFDKETYDNGLRLARNLPKLFTPNLDSEDNIFSGKNYRYKDNVEITVETLQFNFDVDDDVYIGQAFYDYNPMLMEYLGGGEFPIYIWYSTTENYNKNDKIAKGIRSEGEITFVRTGNKIQIESSSVDLSALTSWALSDIDKNIYIANNGNNESVYLNYTNIEDEEVITLFEEEIYYEDIEFDLRVNYRLLEIYKEQASFNINFDLTANYKLLELFRTNAIFSNMEFELDVAYKMLEIVKANIAFNNMDFDFNVNYEMLEITNQSISFNNMQFDFNVTYEKTDAYTITYNLNSGTNNGSNPTTFTNSDIPFPLFPATRSGYKFVGWYSNPDFYGNPISQIANGQNYILYAKWQTAYTVTYNLNDGANDPDNPSIFSIDNAPVVLEPASRNNYSFEGWFEESDFSGSRVYYLTELRNYILYAKWAFTGSTSQSWEAVGSSTNSSAFTQNEILGYTPGADVSPGVDADDYILGYQVRVNDGGFPTTTYYWYKTVYSGA